MLQQAITAAKAGQKATARAILLQLLQSDTTNVQAWLWLSGLVEGDEARIRSLEQAIHCNPDNALLRAALGKARALHPRDLVQEALAAMDAGRQDQARELLLQAVTEDESNLNAWRWLGQVSESLEDQEVCFENVLALEPDNIEAREQLESIRRGQALIDTRRNDAPPDEFYAHAPSLDDEIAPLPVDVGAIETALKDELQCPYCAALTLYDDRTCPHCHQSLWSRSGVMGETGETRSGYWHLLMLEILVFFAGWLLPLLLVNYVAYQLDMKQFGWLFPVYLGLRELLPEEAAVIFGLAPPVLFWLSVAPSALTALIVLCVALRRHALFYVTLVLDGLRSFVLLASLALVLLGKLGTLSGPLELGGQVIHPGLFSGFAFKYMQYFVAFGSLVGIAVSFFSFKLLMSVMDHFIAEERRRLLCLDHHLAPNATSYWLHGRAHAKEGRWAAAALHLRHSLAMEERFEAYAQLVVAYMHLGYDAKAVKMLADAQRFSPNHPQLESLAALLAKSSVAEPGTSEWEV